MHARAVKISPQAQILRACSLEKLKTAHLAFVFISRNWCLSQKCEICLLVRSNWLSAWMGSICILLSIVCLEPFGFLHKPEEDVSHEPSHANVDPATYDSRPNCSIEEGLILWLLGDLEHWLLCCIFLAVVEWLNFRNLNWRDLDWWKLDGRNKPAQAKVIATLFLFSLSLCLGLLCLLNSWSWG